MKKRKKLGIIFTTVLLIIFLSIISAIVYRDIFSKDNETIIADVETYMNSGNVLLINDESVDDKLIFDNEECYLDLDYLLQKELIDYYWDREINRIQFFRDKNNSYSLSELYYNQKNVSYKGNIYDFQKTMIIKDDKVFLNQKFLLDNFMSGEVVRNDELNMLILYDGLREEYVKIKKEATYYIIDDQNKASFKMPEEEICRKINFSYNNFQFFIINNRLAFADKEDMLIYKITNTYVFEKAKRLESICLAWDLVSAKEDFQEFYIPEEVDVIAPTWYNLIAPKQAYNKIVIDRINLLKSSKQVVIAISDNYKSDKNASRCYFYDVSDKQYIDYVHNNSKKIWATFNNSFDKDLTRDLLHQGKHRSRIIDEIIHISKKEGYDGINIDFENVYMTERDVYSAFIKELYCKCKQANIILSVDVAVLSDSETWSRFADRYQIGRYTDYIILMAYDQHVTGTPGSVADIPWIDYGVSNLLESVDAQKVIMAMPFYTRFWEYISEGNIKSTALKLPTAEKVVKKYNIEFTYDEALGQNYFEGYIDGNLCKMWNEDEISIENRLNIYRKYDLNGIGIWALDFGIERIWKMIKKY